MDYALITPTPNMTLENQLLFVNYTDLTIIYDGQWENIPTFSPLNTGPMKQKATTGDIMQFPVTSKLNELEASCC